MWCGRHQSCLGEVDDDGYRTILSLLGLRIPRRSMHRTLCGDSSLGTQAWLPCPCRAKWSHWSARSSSGLAVAVVVAGREKFQIAGPNKVDCPCVAPWVCVQVCWWQTSGVPVQGSIFFGVSSENNCGWDRRDMIQQVCTVRIVLDYLRTVFCTRAVRPLGASCR
jgi:hypothetical protein